jgi:hypothetical protein
MGAVSIVTVCLEGVKTSYRDMVVCIQALNAAETLIGVVIQRECTGIFTYPCLYIPKFQRRLLVLMLWQTCAVMLLVFCLWVQNQALVKDWESGAQR